MHVGFSVAAGDLHAKEAIEVKAAIETILAEHGLTGTTGGSIDSEKGGSVSGSYTKSV